MEIIVVCLFAVFAVFAVFAWVFDSVFLPFSAKD